MSETAAFGDGREPSSAGRSWLGRGLAACLLGAGLYAGMAVASDLDARAAEAASDTQAQESAEASAASIGEPATVETAPAEEPAASPQETTETPPEASDPTEPDPAVEPAAEPEPATDTPATPVTAMDGEDASAPTSAPTIITTTATSGEATTTTVVTTDPGSTATSCTPSASTAADAVGDTTTAPCKPAPVAGQSGDRAAPASGVPSDCELTPPAPDLTPVASAEKQTGLREALASSTTRNRDAAPEADFAATTADSVSSAALPESIPAPLPVEPESPFSLVSSCGTTGSSVGAQRGLTSAAAALVGADLELAVPTDDAQRTSPAFGSAGSTPADPSTRPD